MVPDAARHAGNIELQHVSVPLEVEPLLLTDIAHVTIEIYWVSGPQHGEEGPCWGLWRVETGDPDALVNVVPGRPGLVPVTGHVPLVVLQVQVGVVEPPGQAALISQDGAVGSQGNLMLRLDSLSLLSLRQIFPSHTGGHTVGVNRRRSFLPGERVDTKH